MKRQLIFDGFLYQSTLLSTLKQQTNTLSSTPTLAIINLNQSIISDRYIARKRQAVHSAGMQLIQLVSTSNHLGPLIDDLNHSKDIHGVILQLPLPPEIDSQTHLDRVSIMKDIDGLSTQNHLNMINGNDLFYVQCAVQGVIQIIQQLVGPTWLNHSIAIVGKGPLIGTPLFHLLSVYYQHKHITWIDIHTPHKDSLIYHSQITVLCTGQPHSYNTSSFKKGSYVVDTGVYRGNTLNAFNKDYMEFIGDMKVIDKEYLGGYSTVPGGVGPLCVANVANNLLKAYRLQNPSYNHPLSVLTIDYSIQGSKSIQDRQGYGLFHEYDVVLMDQNVKIEKNFRKEQFRDDCVFMRICDGIEGEFNADYINQVTDNYAATIYKVDAFIDHQDYDHSQLDFVQQNALILATNQQQIHSQNLLQMKEKVYKDCLQNALDNYQHFKANNNIYQPLYLDYNNIRIKGTIHL